MPKNTIQPIETIINETLKIVDRNEPPNTIVKLYQDMQKRKNFIIDTKSKTSIDGFDAVNSAKALLGFYSIPDNIDILSTEYLRTQFEFIGVKYQNNIPMDMGADGVDFAIDSRLKNFLKKHFKKYPINGEQNILHQILEKISPNSSIPVFDIDRLIFGFGDNILETNGNIDKLAMLLKKLYADRKKEIAIIKLEAQSHYQKYLKTCDTDIKKFIWINALCNTRGGNRSAKPWCKNYEEVDLNYIFTSFIKLKQKFSKQETKILFAYLLMHKSIFGGRLATPSFNRY